MQKGLIVAGVIILITGIFWPWVSKLPIGRLPGDIIVDRPNYKFFFPITTMVLLSIILSVVIWLIKKL